MSTDFPLRLLAALTGLGLIAAACGDDGANASPSTSIATSVATTQAPTTQAPTTQAPTSTSEAVADSTTTIGEGQDVPQINDWRLEAESVACDESNLPGSAGGEAVLPAVWAAGNADYVNFIVDGDRRPANVVRDVAGPGNIQVPCDPTLNDGHEITLVAYTGSPGDPVAETAGETLIVVTTATKDS